MNDAPASIATSTSAKAEEAAGQAADRAIEQAIVNAAPLAVQRSRALAVGSLLALIVLGLAWELWLAPLRPGGSWLALKVLPLCIPLAGLLKNRMYTYRWVSLVVWLYFTEGVVRAWGDPAPGNLLALAQVALCICLFAACAMHVRLRFRHRTQHTATP